MKKIVNLFTSHNKRAKCKTDSPLQRQDKKYSTENDASQQKLNKQSSVPDAIPKLFLTDKQKKEREGNKKIQISPRNYSYSSSSDFEEESEGDSTNSVNP